MSDPNATNTNDTETQTLVGIPNEKVAERVALLQADPNYISHVVNADNANTSTIVATMRKQR